MDLAFQQTKYWGLLFLHIGNTVVKFLPGPLIIEVNFTQDISKNFEFEKGSRDRNKK